MSTKIRKWGNSFAVRIPKGKIDQLGLTEGTEVKVEQGENFLIIQPIKSSARKYRKKDLVRFVIPLDKDKQNISENIDEILYGKSD